MFFFPNEHLNKESFFTERTIVHLENEQNSFYETKVFEHNKL